MNFERLKYNMEYTLNDLNIHPEEIFKTEEALNNFQNDNYNDEDDYEDDLNDYSR